MGSQINSILGVIEGAHKIAASAPLRDYHLGLDLRRWAGRGAMRPINRYSLIKAALRNYHVIVTLTPEGIHLQNTLNNKKYTIPKPKKEDWNDIA